MNIIKFLIVVSIASLATDFVYHQLALPDKVR
jgi:hypothetical protein